MLPGIGSILEPDQLNGVLPQLQFHVERARDRICTVGRNLLETQPTIHRYRIFHGRLDRIQTHAPVADGASLGDDRLRQCAAQPLSRNFARR